MSPRRSFGDETGVFVPGLMGAGIILSIVMLLSDAIRKALPDAGPRGRWARRRAAALGRAADLAAVTQSGPPAPVRIRRRPRHRAQALALSLLTAGLAAAAVAATYSVYQSQTGLLSDRGWTLSTGFAVSGLLAVAALIWLAWAVAAPSWLARVASWGPLGELPRPTPTLHGDTEHRGASSRRRST